MLPTCMCCAMSLPIQFRDWPITQNTGFKKSSLLLSTLCCAFQLSSFNVSAQKFWSFSPVCSIPCITVTLVIDDIVSVICFRSCWLSHEVKLARESGSLGFSIAGCKDSHHGDQPVFIKSVRSGSAADKNNIRYVPSSKQPFLCDE